MGQAFIRGLTVAADGHHLSIIEHNVQNARECELLDVPVYPSLGEFSTSKTSDVDVCIVAVKPHDLESISQQVNEYLDRSTVIVSIAAGVSLATLQTVFEGFAVVRAMPNIAASQLLSATAMCSVGVSEQDEVRARDVLESVGTVVRVDESEMNLVTALSGSGPAYFFLLAEYMANAAEQQGLEVETAYKLILQTFVGAAALADGNGSFALLREAVTSPGGTTQAAIEEFEKRGLEQVICEGIDAARVRAAQIDQQASSEDS